MNNNVFTGAGVALITPFTKESREIDFEALAQLIEFQVAAGSDAILAAGTTAETAAMTEEEQQDVIRFVVEKVNKRVPVIAGTGSNNTAKAVKMSKFSQEVGADALLCVTPYYNKTTQAGLVAHFKEISGNVTIPVILYNVPGRTGMNLDPETVKILAAEKNIVAVKEASGDISQVAEIARICPADFTIYSGNDDQIVPVLSLGGKGVISVVSNMLPAETSKMVHAFLDGDVTKAREMQLEMNGLVNILFCETNPIPVKKALQFMGLGNGVVRLPLLEMTPENGAILREEMLSYGMDVSKE